MRLSHSSSTWAGRAVSRSAALGRLISASVPSAAPDAAKYSARTKLGWRGYLEAAILNPKVGGAAHDVIRQAHGAGHEIGLHGGRNHAVWQHEAGGWDRARLEAEVDAVLPTLARLLDDDGPLGFASPGWTTSALLPSVLDGAGLSVCGRPPRSGARDDLGAGSSALSGRARSHADDR